MSWSGSNGLVMYSTTPQFRQRSRMSFPIHRRQHHHRNARCGRLGLSRRQTSQPSKSGSIRSSTMSIGKQLPRLVQPFDAVERPGDT